jgi:hypothetical protein
MAKPMWYLKMLAKARKSYFTSKAGSRVTTAHIAPDVRNRLIIKERRKLILESSLKRKGKALAKAAKIHPALQKQAAPQRKASQEAAKGEDSVRLKANEASALKTGSVADRKPGELKMAAVSASARKEAEMRKPAQDALAKAKKDRTIK